MNMPLRRGESRVHAGGIERVSHCPLCGSADTAQWVEGRDRQLRVDNEIFVYDRCGHCGVLFESLRPTPVAIGPYYTEGYGPYVDHGNATSRSFTKWLNKVALAVSEKIVCSDGFREEIARFYERLTQKPRFLDFGCGAGKFLDRARKFGCDTIGMDFSSVALDEVARRGHRALAVTDADWRAIPDGTVGMVRMNHVIEHLYDPQVTLKLIFDKMAPGGVLHIATPNSDSLAADEYRQHWFGLDCPRHIIIYNPGALKSLLVETGFCDVRVIQEPLIKDRARSWVYKEVDAGRRAPVDVTALADDGLLNLRFAFAARKAARRNRSDRIHGFATKPLSWTTQR
jgi:SAM-dependent methyltransferase